MGTLDIDINEHGRTNIAQGLKRLLADSYTPYLQTHNFHWNVTGPQFRERHLMFEEHICTAGSRGNVSSCVDSEETKHF